MQEKRRPFLQDDQAEYILHDLWKGRGGAPASAEAYEFGAADRSTIRQPAERHRRVGSRFGQDFLIIRNPVPQTNWLK